jgi:hypothetical protein
VIRPFSASSALVGSSQTSNRGSWTSAREFAGQVRQPVAQAERFEHDGGGLDRPRPPPARDEQRHGCILDGGERREEVVGLEDEADVLAAEPHLAAVGHPDEIVAQHDHLPGGRFKRARHDRNERRLPAAARTDEHQEFAVGHVEIDATKRPHERIARAEILRHSTDTNRDIARSGFVVGGGGIGSGHGEKTRDDRALILGRRWPDRPRARGGSTAGSPAAR